MIEGRLPPDPAAARAALYAGRIALLPPAPASLALVAAARAMLEAELGGADVRRLAMQLPAETLFAAIGRIRRTMFTAPDWHERVRAVLAEAGFAPAEHPFDPLRLRTVLHRGHERAEAAAVYVHHRDTWYAHPSALVTGWIALHDLPPEETFRFFPDMFAQPVPNDSHIFDYDAWTADGGSRRIGWQHRRTGRDARYPALLGSPDLGPALGFAAPAGALLLFSGAHLHATLPQATGRARFSLDFRFANLADVAAGRGAPDVDNRSAGSALRDYVRSGGPSAAASDRVTAAFASNPPATTS